MLEKPKQTLNNLKEKVFKIDPSEENKLISWQRAKRGAIIGFCAGVPSTIKTFAPIYLYERVATDGGINIGPIDIAGLSISAMNLSLEQHPYIPIAGIGLYTFTIASLDGIRPAYKARIKVQNRSGDIVAQIKHKFINKFTCKIY